ncbi:MAG: hypothetical protein ABI682_09550 [Acidobacteriota bacterium]
MSLIDEALKRAREQTARQTLPPDPAAAPPTAKQEDPWSYAPLPDRAPLLVPVQGAAAIAGGVLLLAAAAWLLLRPSRPQITAPFSAPSAEQTVPAPARDFPRAIESAAVPGRTDPESAGGRGGLASAGGAAANAGQPHERDLRTGGGSPPPEVFSPGIASGSPRVAAGNRSRTILPGEGAPADRGPAAAKAHSGTFVSPDGTRIELGGIVYSETNPVALINGRVLPVGGVVGSMTIISITENRVELTGDGARVFLSIR